jgi:hypothetical protein
MSYYESFTDSGVGDGSGVTGSDWGQGYQVSLDAGYVDAVIGWTCGILLLNSQSTVSVQVYEYGVGWVTVLSNLATTYVTNVFGGYNGWQLVLSRTNTAQQWNPKKINAIRFVIDSGNQSWRGYKTNMIRQSVRTWNKKI